MGLGTTQEMTLHLPQDVFEMIQQEAQVRLKTPDEIVTEALRNTHLPVRREAICLLQQHIRQQQEFPSSEIRTHLHAHLAPSEEQRLSQLLAWNRERELTEAEQAEAQTLFDRIEEVATEKAAAIWLLSEPARIQGREE